MERPGSELKTTQKVSLHRVTTGMSTHVATLLATRVMKPDYNYTRLPLATRSMLTIPRNQTDPLLIALLTEDKDGGKSLYVGGKDNNLQQPQS